MSDVTEGLDDSVVQPDSLALAQQIDKICDAFEADWKAGNPLSVEQYLERSRETDRERVLRELLPLEIAYRVKAGEQPRKSDYTARFPALDSAWIEQVIAQHAALLTAEFQPRFQPEVVIAGRYVLKQKLGEGGMGEVWVAKQTQPVKRNVAIKLIKTGMDSRAVLTRFEAERQALALMDHPHIARVLDGGITASGQPFFVMELVNGLPVNKFCDEAKLTLQQRLELFVPICQAVQHAHHKGIVHRDLKPSNILVTMIDGRAVPKVIDFGVAKATAGKLTDESLETQFGAVVGTLEYMSPEQAGYSGQDIDTRADIYSLGVILYELLTGLRPIDAKRLKQAAYTEMIRIIKEEEPSKPSTRLSTNDSLPSLAALRQTEPRKLMAILRGELDWVVMKCLEKDRNRRYETATGLARDIERYLVDEPVEARPPSASYRLHKFLLRNKGPVLAALLLLVALVGGIVGTSLGLIRAEQHRALAERQRALAEQAAIEEREAKEAEAEQRNRADSEAARANAKAVEANENAKAAVENAKQEKAQRERADAQTKAARHHLYTAHMNLAQAAWQDARVGAMWNLLDQYPKRGEDDLRGFEWRYWDRLAHGYQRRLDTGVSINPCVAFSSDGQRLASGGAVSDGPGLPVHTVIVWDTATGRKLLALKGHKNHIYSVAFSPDGKRLVSASFDHTIKLWDAATGDELLSINGHNHMPFCVVFSPDGERLASAGVGDQTVKIWDAATGEELLALKTFTFNVAFSPDGKRLVSAGASQTVKIWDATTGEELLALKGHTSLIRCVAFSPDGKRLASAGDDQIVKVWDAATGQELLTLRHASRIYGVAFSPDGKRLASAGTDELVKLWNATTGQGIQWLKGHTHEVHCVAFSPDGEWLASASQDGTAKLWDTSLNLNPRTLTRQTGPIFGMACSPDGKRLAVALAKNYAANNPGEIKVFEVDSGRESLTLAAPTARDGSIGFSPDGKRLTLAGGDPRTVNIQGEKRDVATADQKTAKVWDAITGQELLVLKGHTNFVAGVAFSPDGKWLASASHDRTVKLWDAATGQESLTLTGHTAEVRSVAFSPDGQRLASKGYDQTVKLWDVATGQELLALKGQISRDQGMAFSPNGRRLAVTGLSTLSPGHISSEGRWVTEGHAIKLWNTTTGRVALTLSGHTDWVNTVAYSPDKKRLASGCSDGTVKLWDTTTGQELLTLKGHTSSVTSVAFTPDGNQLVSASFDGTVKLWDATPRPLEASGRDAEPDAGDKAL